jgi:hypothetical protein
MKCVTSLAIALMLVANSAAQAASLSYTQTNDAFAIYVDGEEHNGNFETIYFQAKPNPPAEFTNNSGGIFFVRPPGRPFTYPNELLTQDPIDFPGGLALFQSGLVNIPQELSFTVANLFGTITTAPQPNGDLFLGNVNMPGAGASANVLVQLRRAGNLVQQLTLTIPVPEPSALALAVAALAGATRISRRRRRKSHAVAKGRRPACRWPRRAACSR